VNDVAYQHQLRADFRRRKVHPTIDALIWSYHLGRPTQPIAVTAAVDVNARLDEERRIFATLSYGPRRTKLGRACAPMMYSHPERA
jgi:hypothetical protein